MIVDAGMTELMRPMLYGAFHRIEPVLASAQREALVDFVGPSARRPIRSARIGASRNRRSAI